MTQPGTRTGLLRGLLRGLVLLACLLACLLGRPDAARADDEAPTERAPRVLGPSLRDRGDQAAGAGRLEEALDLYTRWLEADPRDANSWYNLACVHGRRGEVEAALEAFETSLDAGFDDLEHAREDPDLECLRTHARFAAALLAQAARRADAEPAGLERHALATTTIGSYIVLLPPDYATSGATYPVVAILHGSGSTEVGHGRVAEHLGRDGVIYVAPRALHPHVGVFTTSRSPGWTAWPPERDDGPDALDAMALHTDWILRCVDDVGRRYRAHTARVALWGHSQGAGSASVLAARHPERIATIFAYAGYYPEEHVTPEAVAAWKTHDVHIELCHGLADPVVPSGPTAAMEGRLAAAGVAHAVHMIEAQHGLTEEVRTLSRAWVDNHVRAVSASRDPEAPTPR